MFKRCIPCLVIVMSLLFAAPALAGETGFGEIGLSVAEVNAVNQNGAPDFQAGSHPFALVTHFLLKTEEVHLAGISNPKFRPSGGGLKDVRLELPPGFVGDPAAATMGERQVGYAVTFWAEPEHEGGLSLIYEPVYNVKPPPGVPAEFEYQILGKANIFMYPTVRTGGDYGLRVTAPNLQQTLPIVGATVTIWGVPGEAGHDPYRGECLVSEALGQREITEAEAGDVQPLSSGNCSPVGPEQALLTNPTSCDTPRSGSLSVDSWNAPGKFVTKDFTMPELGGCENLSFSPALGVTPDGEDGSTPTGLNVEEEVPQESVLKPEGLSEADVKDTTVALPAGVQLSPSAADGLQACTGDPSDLAAGQMGSPGDQIGFTGSNPVSGADEFTPRMPGSIAATFAGETSQLEPGVNFCPNASKIATVHIKTPLLEEEVEGSVYLAAPQNFAAGPLENPFKSLIALYLVAEAPERGVLVKLPGEVRLCEGAGEAIDGFSCQGAGQIVTTFLNTPQLPYSDLKLEFYGTGRAPLATPGLCGSYNSATSIEPWSETGAVSPTASFQIASGPAGSACSDPLPFSPTLQSGVTNIQAGAFSTLDTTFSREDGQQNLSSVQLHYPPGVSGILTGVPLCGEAQANAGTCGEASKIGETIVSVGLGGDPFSVTGGKVYLTGPYQGAPFGLSIVNPAKAGPFDLQEGRPVIVRAKIEINPLTAALTVTTNTEAQGYAIPHIIDGIPLQIKHVYVNVNRPGFTFNPTSCDPTEITGEVKSAEGASSQVKDPFQVTNCASLKFEPKFSASTSGRTSRVDGASLSVKLAYPSAPFGSQANIREVKVELPKGLPSRLGTLQKACTAAQFHANPAGCPAASVVGHAKAITPLIPVPLEGPAYFVSNGGEAFPNLIVVLQGYGVTVELVGDTFISKAGVTSSTFKTVPDAPVGSFELSLPEGQYSALTTDGNLCKQKLVMPTEFVAQNGAMLHQQTKIAVAGCPKSVRHARKKKHHRRRKK